MSQATNDSQKFAYHADGSMAGSWWPAKSAAIGFDAIRNVDQATQWLPNQAEARAFVLNIEGPAARAKRIADAKVAAAEFAAEQVKFAERRAWLDLSTYSLHIRDVERIERITGLSADNIHQANAALRASRHGVVTIEDLIHVCARVVADATGAERPQRIGDELHGQC